MADCILVGNNSGGGDVHISTIDYVHFDGTVKIALPFEISADYLIKVDFQPDQYVNYMIITGNTSGNFINHITMYGNEYYVGAGTYSREAHFAGTFNERHTIEFNKNGEIHYDGVSKGTYYPTDLSGIYYTLGYRQDNGLLYIGKFYGYKITSISTGNDVCNLVPKKVSVSTDTLSIDIYGLYDTVNNTFYHYSGITGGNDT